MAESYGRLVWKETWAEFRNYSKSRSIGFGISSGLLGLAAYAIYEKLQDMPVDPIGLTLAAIAGPILLGIVSFARLRLAAPAAIYARQAQEIADLTEAKLLELSIEVPQDPHLWNPSEWSAARLDGCRFTNRSEGNSVSLELVLIATGGSGAVPLQHWDPPTSGGRPSPFLAPPLNIPPQESRGGLVAFRAPAASQIPPGSTWRLTVTDHVSGQTIDVAVPGQYP